MKDLAKIIRICTRNNVKRIKYNNIELEFGEVAYKPTRSDKSLQKSQKESTIEQELERLLLEDPLLREQLLEKELLNK